MDDSQGNIAIIGAQFAVDGYGIDGDAITLDGNGDGDAILRVGDGTAAGVDMTAGIGSALTGSARLIKEDAGTLILGGANSYTGGTEVRGGTLIGDTGSLVGDIVNDATLVFNQDSDASFSDGISGSGETVKDGAGTLALAGASATDWTVRAGGLSAGDAAFSGDVSIEDAAAFQFTTGADTAWDGILSGQGAFEKLGNSTLTLTADSSGFDGTTSVTGGLLEVNGVLGGQLSVGSLGAVGGSGQIESLAVEDGGLITPGESIGTLAVNGDLVVESGAIYNVEADPDGSTSDLIEVAGTATLNGGVVQHIGLPGDYAPSSTYTILTAAGGVTGTFDAIDSDFAFLEALLGYTGQTVTMTLERNDVSFAGVGRTINQIATGEAIESDGYGTPLYGAVIGLNDEDARLAFDQLSGELHGSLRSSIIEESSQIQGTIRQRLAQDGTAERGVTVWSQAHGSTARLETDGNARSMRTRGGGLWLGAEATNADGLMLGVAAGSERTTHRAGSAGKADRDGYRLSGYGSGWLGPLGFSGGVTASWDDLETTRTAAFPSFSDQLLADYDAETVHAFAETVWAIRAGEDIFEPFASVARVRAETDGFTETGGVGALSVKGETQTVTFATLGLGWRHSFDSEDGPGGGFDWRLGWRHAGGRLTPATEQAFAGGEAFTVNGLPVEADTLIAELGTEMKFGDSLSLKVDWTGQAGDDSTAQRLAASLNWRF